MRLVELPSLIGTLQFTCKVVLLVRTFLQHAIDLFKGAMRRFYYIGLNKKFFRDLDMWKVFLSKWNGRSLSLESTSAPPLDLELYTDAVGFGGYFR